MSVWFKRLREKQDGITLIELIVVVAIIGVLAWLITPRVLATLNTSKLNSAESVANEIHASLERYAAQNTSYPISTAVDTWAEIGTSLDVTASLNTQIVNTGSWSYDRSVGSDSFCAYFEAKDKDTTWFVMTKAGVKVQNAAPADPATCV